MVLRAVFREENGVAHWIVDTAHEKNADSTVLKLQILEDAPEGLLSQLNCDMVPLGFSRLTHSYP